MLTRKQAQEILVTMINETFAGYTVAVHDVKTFANDVLNTAYNGHSVIFRSKLEEVFANKLEEHFAIS